MANDDKKKHVTSELKQTNKQTSNKKSVLTFALAFCSQHPAKFSDHKSCENGDIMIFYFSYDLTLVIRSKGYMNLRVRASHGKPPPCLVL